MQEVFQTNIQKISQQVELGIVIVNRNNKEFLFRCLESLYCNPPSCSFRLLVVDNASRDGSLKMLGEKFPRVEWIANQTNLGFARANNQAVRLLSANFILLLNPDIQVLPGSIDVLKGFMEANSGVGLAGAKLLLHSGELDYSCRLFYTFLTVIWRATFLTKLFPHALVNRKHLMSEWDHNSTREVNWIAGSCMLVRAKAIEQIGLMDERFFLYFEDVDWCYRFWQAGWSVFYVSQSQMIHSATRQSVHSGLNKEKIEHYKSLIKFLWKYRGFVRSPIV